MIEYERQRVEVEESGMDSKAIAQMNDRRPQRCSHCGAHFTHQHKHNHLRGIGAFGAGNNSYIDASHS